MSNCCKECEFYESQFPYEKLTEACMNTKCECHSTPEGEEWEKEFEGLVRRTGLHLGYRQQERITPVKNFIKETLASQRATLRSRVEGMKKETIFLYKDQNIGYNQALDDVLALINL